ncbi:MAG: hypothetical protein JW395_1801 [Nitrospira sp.]|jgi:predicted DNA-binding transcriptional regulator AlpA|nr:hypothetical protein [Nitrospira sp.]
MCPRDTGLDAAATRSGAHGEEGHELGRLMTAAEVAVILRVSAKSVYERPIQKVRLGAKSVRWRAADVQAFINRRLEDPTSGGGNG